MAGHPKSERQKGRRAGSTPRPSSAGPQPGDPEQFRRFVEAARELGIEEVGKEYERAVDVTLRAPKPDQPMQRRIRGARMKKERP